MAEDAVGTDSGGGATPDQVATGEPPDGPPSDPGDNEDDPDDSYGGLPGAFPYAGRASGSWLFKSYALLGGLAALVTILLFGLALVVLLGNTVGVGGGTFSFVRAFFIFVGFLVVAPLVAPVLFVARRHRRGGSDRRFDAAMAGLGYLFLGSLYVAGVISTPTGKQQLPAGTVLEPVVAALYALPRLAGLVPPALVALAMVVVARRFR